MYKKVLLPLDGTRESEKVVPLIIREINSETEVILLQVLRPVETQVVFGQVLHGSQREEAAVQEAETYLRAFAEAQLGRAWPHRVQAVVAESSSRGIVDFAEREQVDAIALYVRERTGLARVMKGNTSRAVFRKATRPVKVFGSRDLGASMPEPAPALVAAAIEVEAAVHPEAAYYADVMAEFAGMEDSERKSSAALRDSESDMTFSGTAPLTGRSLMQVDLFKGLALDQIDCIASLGDQMTIQEAQRIGDVDGSSGSLYVILRGEAQLMFHTPLGEISVRVAGPGDTFPLAALLGKGVLITTGVALTDMAVVAIPCGPLNKLFDRRPDIGMRVYRAAAQVFAMRYTSTLTHLGVAAERELRGSVSATTD